MSENAELLSRPDEESMRIVLKDYLKRHSVVYEDGLETEELRQLYIDMIIETNLIDLSKITLENYKTYNEKIKYEVPRQWGIRNIKKKKEHKTEEDRKKYLKEYQHEYYLKVTKLKKKSNKGES